MTDPNDAIIGTLAAGRYRILKLLGEGGMGRVYLAEHVAIEKRVALKILRAEFANKGEIVTRFQQEAISASRIKHPNVLDVFDFGQLENGCFFLAMEFLEGNDLADELSRRRVIETARGIRISLQICRALAAAHESGVVHRDMKPENVFLQRTADGEEIVKIVDFGIAQLRSKDAEVVENKRRLTRTGMIFGTPEYMAPEQAGGKDADSRSDIYSVGIIMYEMFTGAVPFTGDTFLGVLSKHLANPTPLMREVYPEIAISASLQAVIMHALEKEPTARYQTMLELAQAISASADAVALGYRATSSLGGPASEGAISAALPLSGAPTSHPRLTLPTTPSATAPTSSTSSPRSIVIHGPGRARDTEAARAETLISAEASARSHAPRAKSGLVLALLAGAALVGGGAWLLTHRGDSTRPTAEPASHAAAGPPALPTASGVSVAPAAAITPVASGVPGEPAVTPGADVHLSVATEPIGAILLKNGFQVCDQTPCEVSAAPAETVEFQAVKGKLKGTAKVLAQRDQKVTIKLLGPAVAAAPKPASPQLCEVEVDGLKILRACK
jgi:serine/threonine-protein kinase